MADSAEAIVVAALTSAGVSFYPDVAPLNALTPYATYQAVGGQDVNDLGGAADLENARVQISTWAKTRAAAVSTMRAARAAILATGALPIGSPVSVYEEDTKLYGSRLDFSIWFKP